MIAAVCTACGTQCAPSAAPPERCAICSDERQFVPASGQTWTTLEALREHHRDAWHELEPGLHQIRTEPWFAISQRALLLCTAAGNVLWDCVSLIDDTTVARVKALGGLAAIAISHPHFQTSCVEWSRALGGVPVHVHAADRHWVQRPDGCIRYWVGDSLALLEGVTLHHAGGHFAGSSVLHWAAGASGRGALLTADTIHVLPGPDTVTFLRSYPNSIPLPAAAVERIARVVQPLAFDRAYGAFPGRDLLTGAHAEIQTAARRYVRWVSGEADPNA